MKQNFFNTIKILFVLIVSIIFIIYISYYERDTFENSHIDPKKIIDNLNYDPKPHEDQINV